MNTIDGILSDIKKLQDELKELRNKEHAHHLINLGNPTELTIAAGVITRTRSYHTVDTEGDAANDDLDTINGGVEGDLLFIHAANSARSVVMKDNTGNLILYGDYTMGDIEDTIVLLYVGTKWFELSRSLNV